MKQKSEAKDKVRICFVGDLSLSFVKRDYEILEKHFGVDVVQPPKKRNLSWLKYILALARDVFQSDLSFCWFAGWHSVFAVFFAKLFGKKSIVVAGGFDVADVSKINYGAFTNFKERLPSRYVLKNSDLIVSVSKSSQRELLQKIRPRENVLIYNGIPLEKFAARNSDKEAIAITVGTVKWSNLRRKGIETFVKTAQYLPNTPFVVVGKFGDDSIAYLKSIALSNVEFTGFVSDKELLGYYQKAKIYCQLSYHESFGIAPAEAMLCRCIPVVTGRFALPEIVGDTGFYVEYGDEKATAEAIKKALDASDDLGEKARQRIKEMFPMERREKEITRIIENG